MWHYVQRGQVCTSTRTPSDLDTLRQDTITLINRIEAETEYKPKKINLCNWCEYQAICPLWEEEKALAAPQGGAV